MKDETKKNFFEEVKYKQNNQQEYGKESVGITQQSTLVNKKH